MSIPLSCTNRNDYLIWRGTPKDTFLVKSAYHLAKEGEALMQVECSEKGEFGDFRRTLCKLRVLNTEKNFLWRACKEILPTKGNLCKRKLLDDPLCPICGLIAETSLHILWECPSARDVWYASGRKLQKSSIGGPTFCHVVNEIFNSYGEDEIKLFVDLVRKIWFRRNEVLHGGSFAHPNLLVQQAMTAVADFFAAQTWEGVEKVDVMFGLLTRWIAPPLGWYKLNWDAALCAQNGMFGMGAVIRDWEGKVVGKAGLPRSFGC